MIRFVAELECDNNPCTETARVGVYVSIESGCSPFGGPQCKGVLEADCFDNGWSDYGDGRVWCPKCVADQFRFEKQP